MKIGTIPITRCILKVLESFIQDFTKTLFLFCRGSSDDDKLDGKRSAQSTPRMKRHLLVHDPSQDGRRNFGSLGSMEGHRTRIHDSAWEAEQRQLMNRSWDCERVLGLDRSWEQERIKVRQQTNCFNS